MEPTRKFVKEGTMMKISKNNEQERHFFLFHDCLVYAKAGISSGTFIFRGMIPLDKLIIEDIPDTESVQNAIQISRTDKHVSYIIHSKNYKVKVSWLRELEIQKEQYMHGAQTQLGIRPIWKLDQSTDTCAKCNTHFNIITRRHHCR